jgi:hypothetical protein
MVWLFPVEGRAALGGLICGRWAGARKTSPMVVTFLDLESDLSGIGYTSVVDMMFGNDDSRNGRVT